MSTTPTNYPEGDADDNYLSDSEVGLATLDAEDAPSAAEAWTGPRCEKCQAPLKSDVVTICRSCGWYPSLGTFVEVDPNWETALDEPAPADEQQPASHIAVWVNLIPRWGWVIIASAFVVVLESVVARFATPAGSTLRTAWSLTQLVIGIATVAVCHVFNFMLLAADDAEIGLLDLFLKPLRLWTRTCQQLPKRLWFFNALVCGLTAAVMSPLVIGGIPYERFWDWGFKEPPKQNLMGAVVDRMKQLDSNNGSDNLEDAIGDFAGKGDLEPDELPKPEPPKPKQKTDCVVLGYQLDRDGRLTTLLLGTAHRSKLVFAGRVEPKLSDEESADLVATLKPLVIKQPFISIPTENVIWVKPKYACRVTYGEQLRSGSLRDIGWDSMLGTMNVPSGGK
jgi:hypothetical protein